MTTYIEVKREDYRSKKYEIVGLLPISNNKFNENLDNYAYINEARDFRLIIY